MGKTRLVLVLSGEAQGDARLSGLDPNVEGFQTPHPPRRGLDFLRSAAGMERRDREARPERGHGGSGFEKARKNIWPTTVVQRCTFHAFVNIRSATTTRPRLQASQELYALGKSLIRTKTAPEASEWLAAYIGWAQRWEDFLAQRTLTPDGGWVPTHARLVSPSHS